MEDVLCEQTVAGSIVSEIVGDYLAHMPFI